MARRYLLLILAVTSLVIAVRPQNDWTALWASQRPALWIAQEAVSATEPITIPLVAVDNDGRPIDNLSKDEVKVFDDGKEQTVVSFSSGRAQPLSLALLMQWSGVREEALPYAELDVIPDFLRSTLNQNDRAFLAIFAEHLNPLTSFTNKLSEINRGVQEAAQIPQKGSGALYDALVTVCRDQLGPRSGRKALVVVAVSDTLSKNSYPAVVEASLRSGTRIYFLMPEPADPHFNRQLLRTSFDEAHRLAEASGGQALRARDHSELIAAFSQIAAEVRSEYLVSYLPEQIDHRDKFHKIKIETTRRKARLLVAEGYYPTKGQGSQ